MELWPCDLSLSNYSNVDLTTCLGSYIVCTIIIVAKNYLDIIIAHLDILYVTPKWILISVLF